MRRLTYQHQRRVADEFHERIVVIDLANQRMSGFAYNVS
jgi:hypothetical protein